MRGHTGPRKIGDGDPIIYRTEDNTDWTEQNIVRLEKKVDSVGTAAVVPDAWLAPRRGRTQVGLFGILSRLTLAISAAAIVALVVTGRLPPLWNTGANGTTTSLWARFVGRTVPTAEPSQPPTPQTAATRAVP